MPKLTIREWYFTQHVPPEIQEAFEKLFGLADSWRKIANVEYASSEPATIKACARALEEILGK